MSSNFQRRYKCFFFPVNSLVLLDFINKKHLFLMRLKDKKQQQCVWVLSAKIKN